MIWAPRSGSEMWLLKLRNFINIRSFKENILLPSSGSKERLQREGGRILVAVLAGDWDKLPRKPISVVSRRERFRDLLSRFGKALIAAAAPFVLVVVARWLKLSLDQGTEKAIITFGVIFGLTSLIRGIDPSASSRVEDFEKLGPRTQRRAPVSRVPGARAFALLRMCGKDEDVRTVSN